MQTERPVKLFLVEMALFNKIGSIFQPSEARLDYAPVHYSSKENSSGRAHKGKLSKSDIGTPNNFKHISHVGFSSMSGLNLDSDVDMKALISLAGVQEEHLDKGSSHTIFTILKKEGTMDHAQKMPGRMTSVEKPNTRTRFRSLSSSSITPSKKRKSPNKLFPHATKNATALPDHTPFNYVQSLRKVPPSSSAQSSNHFSSVRLPPATPPYLKELSQTFSCIPSVHPPAKDIPVLPPHPQFIYGINSKNLAPHPISLINKTTAMASYSLPPNLNTATEGEPLLHCQHSFPQFERDFTASLSHIASNESFVKYEDIPPLPDPPVFAKSVNSETVITPPLSSETLSAEISHGTVLSAPSIPFKLQFDNNQTLQSSKQQLCKRLDPPLNPQAENLNNDSASEELVVTSKYLGQQNEQTFFLDQIKQGVQLKSVGQNLKVESECSSIVGALRAVIQRRHKAIHSSDEDDVEEEWED
ncbi:uncharacterized protein LOC143926987 [Lithobates pipiens]